MEIIKLQSGGGMEFQTASMWSVEILPFQNRRRYLCHGRNEAQDPSHEIWPTWTVDKELISR